jgi:hypothetical protein
VLATRLIETGLMSGALPGLRGRSRAANDARDCAGLASAWEVSGAPAPNAVARPSALDDSHVSPTAVDEQPLTGDIARVIAG